MAFEKFTKHMAVQIRVKINCWGGPLSNSRFDNRRLDHSVRLICLCRRLFCLSSFKLMIYTALVLDVETFMVAKRSFSRPARAKLMQAGRLFPSNTRQV